MKPTNNTYEDFFKRSEILADKISESTDELTQILLQYEPLGTVKDEIARSIDALQGLRDEFESVHTIETQLHVATFFPLNLPLYSLVLFAIAPSAFAEIVHVRTPENMLPILEEVESVLKIRDCFPNLHMFKSDRAEFLEHYVKQSDVVLFTGKYENALVIQKECPHALFIYNGSGVNPAIIYDDADVDLAARKIYEMRTFNSGQDCAGTDAIIVSSKVVDKFITKLTELCTNAVVGSYGNPQTEIGPILRAQYINELKELLHKKSTHVIHEGTIDDYTGIVTPYIIMSKLSEHNGEFHEFFAPVFNVLVFDDESEVLETLASAPVREYSMYVTYFSAMDRLSDVTFARTLKNQIVNDVENGNEAYGGYGSKANFTAYNGKVNAKPILISEEIADYIETHLSLASE